MNTSLRLQHDPFSVEWADFILFKFLLLLVGIIAVAGAAYYRFPSFVGDQDGPDTGISVDAVFRSRAAYVVFMTMEFASQITWVLLILKATIDTGNLLRKEPFLSTRPVQLCYRVLVCLLYTSPSPRD